MAKKKPRARRRPAGAGSDYDVGYGKPPVASQFQQGRSGNPTGGSKKPPTGRQLLEEALDAPVLVSEGGKQVRMAQRRAMFKTLVARAVRGDARATATVLDLMQKFSMLKEDQVRSIVLQIVDWNNKPVDLDGDLDH